MEVFFIFKSNTNFNKIKIIFNFIKICVIFVKQN